MKGKCPIIQIYIQDKTDFLFVFELIKELDHLALISG